MKFFLFIGCFFCYSFLFAQETPGYSYKRFGFVAGVNFSNMNFNKGVPAPATPVKSDWKNGITIGFLINVPLADKLSLQPGYYYNQRNGADKSTNIDYTINYFSLPVLLKYKVSSLINLVAGPQGELLIDAKQNSNGVKSTITHDVEERSIAVTAGIDIFIRHNFFISARYLQGLNHIGIGQRSNVKEFKYEVVNFSIGMEF